MEKLKINFFELKRQKSTLKVIFLVKAIADFSIKKSIIFFRKNKIVPMKKWIIFLAKNDDFFEKKLKFA